MMRKFNKKKGSRQGAILVTVVFILAFAIIFIAAAMAMTQATRKRIYEEAESDQARLTVTSVAESFYRAIMKCEFDDDVIINLAKNSKEIRVQASSSADIIPGLETVNSPSTVSYTTCNLYRVHKAGEGTTDDDYKYFADFTTHIGDQVENVRAELSYIKPKATKGSAPFSTQLDLNSKLNENNFELVGDGKENDTDNIFLARKGSNVEDSDFSSYSLMVYCDGEICFTEEKFKSDDMVFLAGAKLKAAHDKYSGHWDKANTKIKNLFFFGDSTKPSIAVDDDTSGAFGGASGLKVYLCNRSDNSTWTKNGTVYYIDEDGNKDGGTNTPPTTEAFKNKVQKYAKYNAKYKKGGTNAFPTTDDFLTSSGSSASKLGLSTKTPSSYTEKSMKDFLNEQCYKKKNGYVASGVYRFTSDESDKAMGHPGMDNEPYIMVLDGSKDYKFWFKGTFTLYDVIFIIDKPDKEHPVLFVLEDGASISWPGGGNASNGSVGGNGILSVEGRDKEGAEKAYKYVKEVLGKNYKGTKYFEKESDGKYSKYYDGVHEPCAYIIGMGNNDLKFDRKIILEAYIGLFNDEYPDNKVNSHVAFRNGSNKPGEEEAVYVSIMTDGLNFSGDSGHILLPATPSSSSLPAPNPGIKKKVSGFTLKTMKYYYGITKGS